MAVIEHPSHSRELGISALRERLLDWYAANKRDLPWRRTSDAYALIAAEMMLQQTGVERIAPKWQRFVERFPSWEALAAAPLGEVITEWKGLGYNRRAVSLHRIAKAIVEDHRGEVPRDRATLLKLPGVGPYTANAILSFIHGEDVAAIDVNLQRVIGRVVFGDSAVPQADLQAAAHEALPPGHSSDWNQALMDFASLQCTLRRPACLLCPLRDACAYATGAEQRTAYEIPGAAPTRVAAERKTPYLASNRYLRGQVVDALRALRTGESLSLDAVRAIVARSDAPPDTDAAALMAGLVRDGLAAASESAGAYTLP